MLTKYTIYYLICRTNVKLLKWSGNGYAPFELGQVTGPDASRHADVYSWNFKNSCDISEAESKYCREQFMPCKLSLHPEKTLDVQSIGPAQMLAVTKYNANTETKSRHSRNVVAYNLSLIPCLRMFPVSPLLSNIWNDDCMHCSLFFTSFANLKFINSKHDGGMSPIARI